MKKQKKAKNLKLRYYAVGALFLAFCAVFCGRLVYYQLAERDDYAATVVGANTRREIAHAARGNICDRNGTVLVTNEYYKNLMIDYDALPDTRSGVHRVFLSLLEAVKATESTEKLSKTYFPFEGSFPNYEFTAEAKNGETTEHARLLRFVKNNLCEEGEKPEDAIKRYSAHDIAIYIAEKYNVIELDEKGGDYGSEFSAAEIDQLIELRYAMELAGFGALSDYLLVEDAGAGLISYISERHIGGARFEPVSKRVYNFDGYASHILGTMGSIPAEEAEDYLEKGYSLSDQVGRGGCERAFEEYLRGEDGVLIVVEDDDGNVIGSYYEKEPIPGRDVYLTIDIGVQMAAEDALRKNIEQKINSGHGGNADSGAVVATDPKTGGIIAIASYPTYDLSSFNANYGELAALEVSPLLNRALMAYAPGSTFKVGMALAALEEGIIESDTVISTKGLYKGLACSHYAAGSGLACCGDINVEEALMVSCNYFFSDIGDRLTIDKIRSYASEFGFGEGSGIEFGESTGNIASSSPHAAAIGQSENLCTPLQVSQYIAMVSNGGTRYSAHLLYAVKDPVGNVEVEEKIEVTHTLDVDGKNLDSVKKGMYSVVSGDEASSLVRENFVRVGGEYKIGGEWTTDKNGSSIYVGGVRVGGKTGTAETADSKAGKCSDNAWFTGFAPYEDPQIVVTCFIEKGITGGYSSYTVAETMDAYFKRDTSGGAVG